MCFGMMDIRNDIRGLRKSLVIFEKEKEMMYYTADQIDKNIIVSLEKGDFLRESITDLAKRENIRNGVAVSGIATFDVANFQMTTVHS